MDSINGDLVYYFDFYIGLPRSHYTSWRHDDFKIFGKTMEDAIKRYFIASTMGYLPAMNLIRRVDQFSRKKKQGKTVNHYSKIAVFDENDVRLVIGEANTRV